MFLRFTNFYKQFIQDFKKIASLFTLILNTSELLARNLTLASEGNFIDWVGNNSKVSEVKIKAKTLVEKIKIEK